MSGFLYVFGFVFLIVAVVSLFKPAIFKNSKGEPYGRLKTFTVFILVYVAISSLASSIDVSKSKPVQEAQTQNSDAVAKVESSIPQAAAVETKEVVKIKPEQIVTFPTSAIACIDKDDLQEVMTNYMKGEVTKGNSKFISKDNPEARCIMLNTKLKYKVLSVEYNNDEIGLLEVVGINSTSATGAWTLSMTAEPVK
ncbi:hypothetical protein [Chromobacterium haemolyticum]|uniref:hypothetical protein n=1 Tax=Chromobacterium haemolyticum TaxID=394935 RepID=UPI001178BF5D|nr:hypothetical protein [Chromobacterium haemolyticum]